MPEKFSMYRDAAPGTIIYHNKNERPAINVPHLHSRYEIYYNISGANGFFVDKKFYACRGRDLFVIPKAKVHKVIVDPGVVYERCIISIDPGTVELLRTVPQLRWSMNWLDLAGTSLPGKVCPDDGAHSRLIGYVSEYNSTDDELYKFSVLVRILAFAGALFKTAQTAEEIAPDTVSGKAILLIEENFRDIKISEIAEKLFISESYLSRIFRSECGITISQYLKLRKLAEAKKYLYMGVSVKEVCSLAGFNNYSNFIRTFKKTEGCSPGNMDHLFDPI